MTNTIISFEGPFPTFNPNQDLLDPGFLQQSRIIIQQLVTLAKLGFPYSACDTITITQDVKKNHLVQISQKLAQSIDLMKQQKQVQYVNNFPLFINCSLLQNLQQGFQPNVIAYILTIIFPELNLNMEVIIDHLTQRHSQFQKITDAIQKINVQSIINNGPWWQQEYLYQNASQINLPCYNISISLDALNPQIKLQVEVQDYLQAVQLLDSFMLELVSILRILDYPVFDIFSGIGGQIQCKQISPLIMGQLIQYYPAMKTALGLKALYLENDAVDELLKDSKLNQQSDKNDKPIVISVDERYDENSIGLLQICLNLSSKSSLQYIEGSSLLGPQDIVSLMFMSSNSYRTFSFAYPELLKPSAMWWLLQTIPSRQMTVQHRMRDDLFQGYATVNQIVPDTFTMPIKGQLVFITRLKKHFENCICQCCCQNQMCIRNQQQIEEEYIMNVDTKYYENSLHQLFIDRSIYIDLLCTQGACCYYNDIDFQQSTFKSSLNQNSTTIQQILKHFKLNPTICKYQIKSEAELTELAMQEQEGIVNSARSIRIQGIQVLVLLNCGLFGIQPGTTRTSINFSYNNIRSRANAIVSVNQIQASQNIAQNISLVYYGKLANTFESKQKLMKEVQATACAFLFLCASPNSFDKLKQLIFDDKQKIITDLIQKRKINLPTLQVLHYLDNLSAGSIQEQMQFRLMCCIYFKIFQQKPIQFIMNNKAENEQINTKIIYDFCQTFKNYIKPFTNSFSSNHTTNIQLLSKLYKFYSDINTWPLTQQCSLSMMLTEKQKPITEIDHQKMLSCYPEKNIYLPDFVQFYNDESVCVVEQFGLQFEQNAFRSMNVKLFQNLSSNSNKYDKLLMAALNLDAPYPSDVCKIQIMQQNANVINQIVLNQVLMSCDVIQQSYDVCMRLLLKIIAKKFSQRVQDENTFFYNPFSDKMVKLEVKTYQDLCLYISSTMQHQFIVPIKPTDFYVYQQSTKLIFHAKELVGQMGLKPDFIIAIPDLLNVSYNTIQIVKINQIFKSSQQIFEQIYGPLFYQLISRIFKLFELYQEDISKFDFLSQEQIQSVILKKLTPKLFYADKIEEVSTKLLGQFYKNIDISENDTSLPYNIPIIMTTNKNLNTTQEIFNVQVVETNNDDLINIEYMVDFLQYFQYLLGFSKAFDPLNQIKFMPLLKYICKQNNMLLQTVIKLMVTWCGVVRTSFIDATFLRQKLDDLQPSILHSFYCVLCVIFNYEIKNCEFEVLNGLLTKHLIKNKPFSDLFIQDAFNFIEIEQLQLPNMWQFSTKLLSILLCLINNIPLVFTKLSDADFIGNILQINVNKILIRDLMCNNCENQKLIIKNPIFYADILEDFKYLVPKSQYSLNIDIKITKSQICSSCIAKMYKNTLNTHLIITEIDFKPIQNITLLENCKYSLNLNQIRNQVNFIKDNKIDENLFLMLFENEHFIESINGLLLNITKKLYFEDPYNVLFQILNPKQMLPCARGKGVINHLDPIQTLKLYDSLRLESPQSFDIIKEIIKRNDLKLTEALFLCLKGQDLFQVRHMIDPEQKSTYDCSIGREGVYNCINKLSNVLNEIPKYQFKDVMDVLNVKQFWSGESFTNQYSKIIIGSKINVIWFFSEIKQDQQKFILNEVYNNLYKSSDIKWTMVHSITQINKTNQNYCCQIQIQNNDMLKINLENISTFQPNMVCLVVFANNQIDQQTYLSMISKYCIYQTIVAPNYKFQFEQFLTREQLVKWEIYDQQMWRNLVYTSQQIFKQQVGKVQFLSTKTYDAQQLDIIFDKVLQCNLLSYETAFKKLDLIFSQSFINYFKSFAQSIQASPDVAEWRMLYGGAHYLLIADQQIVYKLLEIPTNTLLAISKQYLQFSQMNLQPDQMQQINTQIKPLIDGLETRPNKFITPYLNAQKQLQAGITQTITLDKTSQIPQLFPAQLISFQFCEYMLKLKQWQDVQIQQFEIFIFFYFVTGRIYESEVITIYILQSNDPRIERQKINVFIDILFNFISKILKVTRQQLTQQQALEFMLNNRELSEFVCQMIHSIYKSDAQHYVQNMLIQQSSNEPQIIVSNLRQYVRSLALDCFDKNLQQCIFFIKFVLKQQQQIDNEYWLILVFYSLIFRFNNQITMEQACMQPKDQRTLSVFKLLRAKVQQNQIISPILDILSIEQLKSNQFVMNNLVKHILVYQKFSVDQQIALKELSFLLKQHSLDHNAILQVFTNSCKIKIFDMQNILESNFCIQFQVNSLSVFLTLLKWWYQYVLNQYRIVDIEKQKDIIKQLFILKQQKFQIPTDLKSLNENQPKNQDLMTEASLNKILISIIEQLIGHLLALLFNEGQSIRFVGDVTKQLDSIQINFYDQLKKVNTNYAKMIVDCPELDQIFKLIFMQAKQQFVNQTQETPKWSLAHNLNCQQYYQQQVASIQCSNHAQTFAMNREMQIPSQLKKYIDDNDKKFAEQHVKRLIHIQSEVDFLKPILVATEAFLIETAQVQSIYTLLAQNHDECLGLWLPGHVFESRLGIVHADCGLKDSRFDKTDATQVKVRFLDQMAVRLSWILAFSCVYLSLKTNLNTMDTSKEVSILSDEELLGVPRDTYCVGVIQTCVSIIQQIKCCFSYEVYIIYQQFLTHLANQMKKGGNFVPRTSEQRDQIELMIKDAALVDYTEILKKFETKNVSQQLKQSQQQSIQIKEEDYLSSLVKLQFDPYYMTDLFNSYQLGVQLQFLLQQKMLAQQIDSDSLVKDFYPEILQKFLKNYSKLIGKFTISGGCQENELPILQDDVQAGQLIRFSQSDQSDFCVLDEFIRVSADIVSGFNISKGMGICELGIQAWLM